MSARAKDEEGFALLLVIWVLAILAVLAAGFAATTRTETRLARNLVEGARAQALAEAGVTEAIAGLLIADPRSTWRADGTQHLLSFAGGEIRVRIEDEGGKIDLNTSAPELLAGLCAELAIDPDVQTAIVQAVVARRAAVAPPPQPATLRINPFANFPIAAAVPGRRDPKLTAFGTVDELRQVPGVDRASFERLRPFLTVYAQSALVNSSTAPRAVLLAIPGMDPRQVDQFLAARAARTDGPASAPPPPLPGGKNYVGGGGLVSATIIADARTDSGASFRRRAVVSLTGAPASPAQVMEWRQDLGDAGDAEESR